VRGAELNFPVISTKKMEMVVTTGETALCHELLKIGAVFRVEHMDVADVMFLDNNVKKLLVERKDAYDLAQTIIGHGSGPVSGQRGDQEMRLVAGADGALVMYVVEGLLSHYEKDPLIHDFSGRRKLPIPYGSCMASLEHKMLRQKDGIRVHQVNDIEETAHFLVRVQRTGLKYLDSESILEREFSSTISVRKRDNHLKWSTQYAWMLQCIVGMSESRSRAVMSAFPTMALLCAQAKAHEDFIRDLMDTTRQLAIQAAEEKGGLKLSPPLVKKRLALAWLANVELGEKKKLGYVLAQRISCSLLGISEEPTKRLNCDDDE